MKATEINLNSWADGKQFVVADPANLYSAYRRWCVSVGETSSHPRRFAVPLQILRSAWQQMVRHLLQFVRKAR